jgi:hypothetical protein
MRAPSAFCRNSGITESGGWKPGEEPDRVRLGGTVLAGALARQVCSSSFRAQRHRGAGKGVKDDEPGATARQATSTTTRRTPTCGRRAPAAASDRGGGSLERPPHWPSWPSRPCARSSLRLPHALARLTDAPLPDRQRPALGAAGSRTPLSERPAPRGRRLEVDPRRLLQHAEDPRSDAHGPATTGWCNGGAWIPPIPRCSGACSPSWCSC